MQQGRFTDDSQRGNQRRLLQGTPGDGRHDVGRRFPPQIGNHHDRTNLWSQTMPLTALSTAHPRSPTGQDTATPIVPPRSPCLPTESSEVTTVAHLRRSRRSVVPFSQVPHDKPGPPLAISSPSTGHSLVAFSPLSRCFPIGFSQQCRAWALPDQALAQLEQGPPMEASASSMEVSFVALSPSSPCSLTAEGTVDSRSWCSPWGLQGNGEGTSSGERWCVPGQVGLVWEHCQVD